MKDLAKNFSSLLCSVERLAHAQLTLTEAIARVNHSLISRPHQATAAYARNSTPSTRVLSPRGQE